MTNYCHERKDSLLEAALSETPGAADAALQEHLQHCSGCREQLEALRARRARMEPALPLIAQGAEPPVEFHARVMQAAAEEKPRFLQTVRSRFTLSQRRWLLAVPALAGVTIAAVLLAPKPRPNRLSEEDVAAVTPLANFQSPTAALLETPGQELLRGTPRVGETYFNISAPTQRENHQ